MAIKLIQHYTQTEYDFLEMALSVWGPISNTAGAPYHLLYLTKPKKTLQTHVKLPEKT